MDAPEPSINHAILLIIFVHTMENNHLFVAFVTVVTVNHQTLESMQEKSMA